jgi:hypothetical protein
MIKHGQCAAVLYGCRMGAGGSNRWQPGDVIVRREVLGLDPVLGDREQPTWADKAWFACPVHVVEDSDDQLVTFIAPGAEFGFVDGDWPTPDHRHPWHGRLSWHGHGCLMVQRPGDHHAVFHFWEGPRRDFAFWYINLQAAFRRTALGYDTQDFELDLVVLPDRTWTFKDRDVLDQRVKEGRFSQELAEWVVHLGDALAAELEAGHHWWDPAWVGWEPDPSWRNPSLTMGWESG